MRKPRR